MFRNIAVGFLLVSPLVCSSAAKDKYQQPRPVQIDHDGQKWADKTLKKMSLEEKVGQMFMVWARVRFLNLASPEYLTMRDAVQKFHVGGFAAKR